MQVNGTTLLAFGAHPDDIEFGCGGVIAGETQAGCAAHFVVCSRGESATSGTPAQRTKEARIAAKLLGATIEFINLGGDAHLEVRNENVLRLAGIIRGMRPDIVFAPTLVENQHPDHARLGRMVRDAARLARYGGVKELRHSKPHPIGTLLFYAVTPEAEPADLGRVLIDVSAPAVMSAWTAAMGAHASQTSVRNYVELQLTRARLHGLRGGVANAIPLFPNDPPVLESVTQLGRAAREF